jgi:tRNA A37 threonylcarbamoyltransferase TsaD
MRNALPVEPIFADPKLCTDNGGMIAAAGYFMAQTKVNPSNPQELDIMPGLSL